MHAYSEDLRKKIVEAVERGTPKIEVAGAFGVGISSVKRYVAAAREGRSLARADAAVAGQLLGTVVRAIGTELRVREQEEILERLGELETLLEPKREGDRWGA